MEFMKGDRVIVKGTDEDETSPEMEVIDLKGLEVRCKWKRRNLNDTGWTYMAQWLPSDELDLVAQ